MEKKFSDFLRAPSLRCKDTVQMTQFINIYEKSFCVAPFLMAHHQVGRSPMHIGKMIVIIKSMKDRNQRSRSRLSRSKHAHSIIAIVWSSPRKSLDMDGTISFWLVHTAWGGPDNLNSFHSNPINICKKYIYRHVKCKSVINFYICNVLGQNLESYHILWLLYKAKIHNFVK